MATIILRIKEVIWGYILIIESEEDDIVIGKMIIGYWIRLENDKSPFYKLDLNIENDVETGDQFFHEYSSDDGNFCWHTGCKYVNGVLSFFTIENSTPQWDYNYTEDE